MASPRDYLKLHFIVFLWGFSAILGKLVSVSALELVLYRGILAIAGMALLIHFRRGVFRLSKGDMLRLLGIGLIVGAHWLSFFGAARVSNVSVSLVGFATSSLWTALLEPHFKKERVKKFELALGFVVLAGLYIIFSIGLEYRLGLLIGVFSGFTAALFSVLNSQMVSKVPATTITFYEMIGVTLFGALCLPFAEEVGIPIRFPQLPSVMDVVWIVILTGACSIYAYTVAVELMKRISVFMIQLTLNLEPVYGIIMAVIVFGQSEKMNINFYIGTLVILAAVLTYPLIKKRFDTGVIAGQSK